MTLITVPSSFKVVDSSFRLVSSVTESESPFSYQQQLYDWGGTQWQGEVSLKPYTYNDSADLRAFLAQLNGKENTFLYGDPDYLVKGPRGGVPGTPLVAGGSQTGTSLNVDGFTALQTNVVRAGDYLQLDTGADSELYMVVSDANSDSSGAATLTLNRPLISSPADNEACVFTNARGVFRLTDNVIEWNSNRSSITTISLAFKEAL